MQQNEEKKYKRLTLKQEEFCRHFVINNNGLKSAILAGYSKNSAAPTATDLLKLPNVQNYIAELRAEAKKNEPVITINYVLNGLKEIAERCLQRKAVMKFDWSEKALVQEQDEEGNAVWTFDAQGANKAFELMGRHLGMFERDNSKDQPLIVVEITNNTMVVNNNDGSITTTTETQAGHNSQDTATGIYTMLPPLTEE